MVWSTEKEDIMVHYYIYNSMKTYSIDKQKQEQKYFFKIVCNFQHLK